MAKKENVVNVGRGIEDQIVNRSYQITVDTPSLTIDALREFFDGPSTTTIKPKRKYVRKAVIASKGDLNKALEGVVTRLKRRVAISSHKTIRTRRIAEEYFSCIIKHLNPTLNFKVYVDETLRGQNYISWNIKIAVGQDMDTIYGDESANFCIEELQGNCSSVGIHHFNGTFLKGDNIYGTNKYIFSKQEQADVFIQAAVDLCKMFNYTNILYTISQESNEALVAYVEKNAKEILEFKSKRNQHIIKYYSQII